MILYISKHNPFGKTGGGVLASHALLKAFSIVVKGNIDLCCADSIKDIDSEISLNKINYVKKRTKWAYFTSIFTGEMHRYGGFVKQMIRSNPQKYDLVVFDHSSIGGTLVQFVNSKGIRTITIHHNYEPAFFADNERRRLVKFLFLRHVKHMERQSYKYSAANLFLTSYDKQLFQQKYGETHAYNYIIGIFDYRGLKLDDYMLPANSNLSTNKRHPIFVISGSLHNVQTEDGVLDFLHNYFANLPADSELIIAGRNPSERLYRAIEGIERIRIVANPEKMDDIIRDADVYICPIRLGGGIKLRVMDGLRNGLPVIAHEVSSRGYEDYKPCGILHDYYDQASFRQIISNNDFCNQKRKSFVIQKFYETFSLESGITKVESVLKII